MNLSIEATECRTISNKVAQARGARISFIKVAKQYGSSYALRPTSVDVQPGEFFALIGTSVCESTPLTNQAPLAPGSVQFAAIDAGSVAGRQIRSL